LGPLTGLPSKTSKLSSYRSAYFSTYLLSAKVFPFFADPFSGNAEVGAFNRHVAVVPSVVILFTLKIDLNKMSTGADDSGW